MKTRSWDSGRVTTSCSGRTAQRERPIARPERRSGLVLVLVVALLGILFVIGVVFLQTTRFDVAATASQNQEKAKEKGVDSIAGGVAEAIGQGILSGDGAPYGMDQGRSLVRAPGVDNRLIRPSYGDLPGVHKIYGQVEPTTEFANAAGRLWTIFPTEPDIFLKDRPFEPTTTNGPRYPVNTIYDSDYPTAIDADGDGIDDTIQLPIAVFGIVGDQANQIAAIVNDPDQIDPEAFMGLRIVDHNGMVNVNYSHPLLVETILGDDYVTPFAQGSKRYFNWPPVRTNQYGSQVRPNAPFYVPETEESALRRRSAVASRQVPATYLQGNPYATESLDPKGGGEMGFQLFAPGSSVMPEEHRWWPFTGTELLDPKDPDYLAFRTAMTRGRYGNGSGYGQYYDRRHVITTVSHDDLLMRGGGRTSDDASGDWVTRMAEVYATSAPTERPVSYHLYPFVDLNGDLKVDNNDVGAPNGRIQLSLPWLQDVELGGLNPLSGVNAIYAEWLDGYQPDQPDDRRVDEAVGLIQAAFTMLLLNADEGAPYFQDQLAKINRDLDGDGAIDRFDIVSLIAASLTANLIDFADYPNPSTGGFDPPTKIDLRVANPGSTDFGTISPQAVKVYGLEKQPFMTEVTAETAIAEDTQQEPDPMISGWAVELYNPYETDLDLTKDYGLYVAGGELLPPNASIFDPQYFGFDGMSAKDGVIPAGTFKAYFDQGANADLFQSGGNVPASAARLAGLTFKNGETIFLVQKDATDSSLFVVDQFTADGETIARVPPSKAEKYFFTQERMIFNPKDVPGPRVDLRKSPWTAPVPVRGIEEPDYQSLGSWNTYEDDKIRNVEVQFANTGDLKSAFPTTGSLLLILRVANMSDRAFTTLLEGDVAAGAQTYKLAEQIDNGHMPIFDPNFLHALDPADQQTFPRNLPAGSDALPWGQLVFDYFTALPLDGPGIKRSDAQDYDPAAGPRVEENGLKVHGRININTAPWSVLAGLPLVPAKALPATFRAQIKNAVPDLEDDEAAPLGFNCAQAIVSYRDGRREADQVGGYDQHRGWNEATKMFARRGTGFMTVGELANVRRIDAEPQGQGSQGTEWFSYYRVDGGVVFRKQLNPPPFGGLIQHRGYDADAQQEDYVEAAALLVAMGDWTTTRSHVETIYGMIRGKIGNFNSPTEVEGVHQRAIRYQETLDRLPLIEGADAPARVGPRTISNYKDAFND